MSIPILIVFVVFFALLGPVFLYWFSRHAKDLLSKRPSFIGFPEDGRTDRGDHADRGDRGDRGDREESRRMDA